MTTLRQMGATHQVNASKEDAFIPPLIKLVEQGDLRWAEAVKWFREEFGTSLRYVMDLGLYEALQKADPKGLAPTNVKGVTK